jgi:hypothetical protein
MELDKKSPSSSKSPQKSAIKKANPARAKVKPEV